MYLVREGRGRRREKKEEGEEGGGSVERDVPGTCDFHISTLRA